MNFPDLDLKHIKPGDWFTLGLGGLCISLLTMTLWNDEMADKAIIRSGGKIFRELALSQNQQIKVPGPLGISLISIKNRRVRVSSDPSPRQYCVKQGWITKAGEIALCLPNQVSVELSSGHKRYDSLNY